MQKPKDLVRTSDYDLYRTKGARTVCILVHGLGGSKGTAYWSDLAQLLRYEPDLEGIDICFWGYPSSVSPFANFLALFRRGRRISTVPETARALSSLIDELVSRFGYESVELAGHSLGGAISILATEYRLETVGFSNVKRVCFMATPQSSPQLAKAISGAFRWNPHIKWLGSENVTRSLSVSLSNMRLAGVHATYIHYTLDEVLPLDERIEFDSRGNCQAPHGWPGLMVERSHTAYHTLRSWITAGKK